MGLFSFLKPKNNNQAQKHYLALDLGTETVKCAIVRNSFLDQKGFILGYGEGSLPAHSNLAGQILDIHAYFDATQIALDKAIALSGVKPPDVIAGISGPKINHQITQQRFSRVKPQQKITAEELQIIFRQVENQSKKTLRTFRDPDQLELINAAILQVTIDGVDVVNPLDFTGHELNIAYFVSYAPILQLNALQSVLDECKLNLVSIVNEPYCLLKSFDSTSHLYKNSLFIDIGGDLTHVGLIDSSQIRHASSFPGGGRQFTNLLAKNLTISYKKAEQYKLDYSAELLASETEQQFSQLFSPLARQWFSSLVDYLENIIDDYHPEHIFLSGGSSLLPEIKRIIKFELPRQDFFTARPEVHFLHPVDLENIVDKTTLIKSPAQIMPLCLAKMGLNFFSYDNPFEKMIKKLMQTLRT